MSSPEITNSKDRADFIRKGNELFNKGDIVLAYKCYTMADYSAGIEKIADHYFYNEKSPAKAIVLYKKLAKDTGNERVQEKLDEVAQKIVKVIRKWVAEDVEAANKPEDSLKQKRQYLAAVIEQQKTKFHTREPIPTRSKTTPEDIADNTNNTTTSSKNTSDKSSVKEAPYPFNKFNKKNKQ